MDDDVYITLKEINKKFEEYHKPLSDVKMTNLTVKEAKNDKLTFLCSGTFICIYIVVISIIISILCRYILNIQH